MSGIDLNRPWVCKTCDVVVPGGTVHRCPGDVPKPERVLLREYWTWSANGLHYGGEHTDPKRVPFLCSVPGARRVRVTRWKVTVKPEQLPR